MAKGMVFDGFYVTARNEAVYIACFLLDCFVVPPRNDAKR